MKFIQCIFLVLFTTYAVAQNDSDFGLKAGLNYNSNGKFFNDAENAAEDPSKNIGYHVGLFGKIDLGLLYLRPEAIYTRTSSEYRSGNFKLSKLDAPILLGADILGPISIFAGPSLQYILKNEFKDFSLEEANDTFTVGAQFGVALNFERIGVDLRYERGLSKNEIDFTDIDGSRVDARPDQFILSLSLKL